MEAEKDRADLLPGTHAGTQMLMSSHLHRYAIAQLIRTCPTISFGWRRARSIRRCRGSN
jgi:hypothetical protein